MARKSSGSIKEHHISKAQEYSAKHKALKKRTTAKVSVKAKDSDIGYKITDHKGTILKHHKGAGRFEMK